jgi:hypothetical protein
LTSVNNRILDTWAMANIDRFLVMVQNDSIGFSLPIVEFIAETPDIWVDNTFVPVAANLTGQKARTLGTLLNNSQLPI